MAAVFGIKARVDTGFSNRSDPRCCSTFMISLSVSSLNSQKRWVRAPSFSNVFATYRLQGLRFLSHVAMLLGTEVSGSSHICEEKSKYLAFKINLWQKRSPKGQTCPCGQVWDPVDFSSHTSARSAHKSSYCSHNSRCLAPLNLVSH